jgi:hypothetical protein
VPKDPNRRAHADRLGSPGGRSAHRVEREPAYARRLQRRPPRRSTLERPNGHRTEAPEALNSVSDGAKPGHERWLSAVAAAWWCRRSPPGRRPCQSRPAEPARS